MANNIPEKALEPLEGLEHPKDPLNSAIKEAKDTITAGSVSVKEGLAEVKDAAVNAPKEAGATPLESLDQLVHSHPIDATKELASGTGKVIDNLVKVATSPARLGVAGVSAGAKIIAESPFRIWNTIDRGANRVFDLGRSIWSSVDKKIDKIVSAGKAG